MFLLFVTTTRSKAWSNTNSFRECRRCGVVNADNSSDNLLWDDATKKW